MFLDINCVNVYLVEMEDNRPFNLHPIFSFEKMGIFATLKKRVEFNLNFFRVATWGKAGFQKVNKKNRVAAEKKSWWMLPNIFSSSCPRKSQVAPSNHFSRCRLKGRVVVNFLMFPEWIFWFGLVIDRSFWTPWPLFSIKTARVGKYGALELFQKLR